MRFLINEDIIRCTMGNKGFQNRPYMRAFDAAGQFSVRKSTGAAFAKLNIGIRIQFSFFLQEKHVLRSPVNRFATFDEHGVCPGFCQSQGGEKPGGTGTDDKRGTVKSNGWEPQRNGTGNR